MTFEQTLQQIVHEAVYDAISKSQQSHLPLALTVEQAAEQAGVGLTKMREWTRREGFPAIRDGKRVMIPTRLFIEWLEREARNV